jgi:hypothetical protein
MALQWNVTNQVPRAVKAPSGSYVDGVRLDVLLSDGHELVVDVTASTYGDITKTTNAITAAVQRYQAVAALAGSV